PVSFRKMRLPLVFALAMAALCQAFCPLEKHQICNPGTKHACVCAIAEADKFFSSDRLCDHVAENDDNGEFPAVSITFDLEKEHDDDESWPQKEIEEGIVSALSIPKNTLVILRANCIYDDEDRDGEEEETEERLVVQFAVLKKSVNGTLPHDEGDFVDAEELASKLKVCHSDRNQDDKLGGLKIEKVEFVDQLIDIDLNPSNWHFIVLAVGAIIIFGFLLVLGCCCYKICKRREYGDELQRRPV
ncbi:hypothetical protein PMAYCL1PPCAC_14068, partial [Pristionchus mayeri]